MEEATWRSGVDLASRYEKLSFGFGLDWCGFKPKMVEIDDKPFLKIEVVRMHRPDKASDFLGDYVE